MEQRPPFVLFTFALCNAFNSFLHVGNYNNDAAKCTCSSLSFCVASLSFVTCAVFIYLVGLSM